MEPELLATEEARRAIILGLIGQVAQTYFELRALDLELEVTRRNVKTRKGTLRIVNARYEDGLVSGLDQARSPGQRYEQGNPFSPYSRRAG